MASPAGVWSGRSIVRPRARGCDWGQAGPHSQRARTRTQDPDTGALEFRNNITLERLDRPPEGVDLFGGMVSLRHLNLSHNKLVQVPTSVATLKDLQVRRSAYPPSTPLPLQAPCAMPRGL